jgi:diguanylate cyclase (GGDEF)-like protein
MRLSFKFTRDYAHEFDILAETGTENFDRSLRDGLDLELYQPVYEMPFFDQLYDEKLSWLAKNAPAEFCIVSADLNGLKKANDAIGHRAGDELITGAAECLSAAFEGIDTIYRTGGDEFCVIMTGPIAKAQLCIARLEDLMSQWKGRYNSSISISTGVASNENHDSIESIVAAADQNMYEYKRNYYISQGIDRRRR